MGRSHVWVLVALYVGLATLLCIKAALTVNLPLARVLPWLAVFGLSAFLQVRFKSPTAAMACEFAEANVQLGMISVAGIAASYGLATASSGYVDQHLAAFDHGMGFDWIAAYRFLEAHPLVEYVLRLAYLSIFVSPPVTIALLVWRGHGDRARCMVWAFAIALAVCLALFFVFPA